MLKNKADAEKNEASLLLLMTKFKFQRRMLLHTKSNEGLFLLKEKFNL
jgi:hypothetical protein